MADVEKRVRGIDLLRGLCIIAVILNHINLRIRLNESSFGKWIGSSATDALVWNGHYGVRIFFVISGFLITTWSLKRWKQLQHLNLKQFYSMRFARIAPCLIGLLTVLAIFDRLGVPRFVINTQHTTLAHALFAALTFHTNWLEARTGYLPAAWDILWSLSVEEVFYLFFPILCAVFKKPAILIVLFSVFIVAGPFARTLYPRGLWVDYGYLCCMDGIAMGCIAAILCARIQIARAAKTAMYTVGTMLAVVVTICQHAAARIGLYKIGLDETVLEIGIALLLIVMQQRFDEKQLKVAESDVKLARPTYTRTVAAFPASTLAWFGRNSYEVYLTHMFVVWPVVWAFGLTHATNETTPLSFFLAIAIAGVLGQIVARYYSEPLNRCLRKKLMGSSQRVTAVSSSFPRWA